MNAVLAPASPASAYATARPDVYIHGAGRFLPGAPVGNEEMEDYLGKVHGQASRARAIALRQNGIRSRHYALDREGRQRHSAAEMAALAIQHAFANSPELRLLDSDYLAVCGSFGDRILPGLASPVQHALRLPELEIASFQSVCGSAAMALQAAFLQLRAGEKRQAIVAGSEFVSRVLRASYLEPSDYAQPGRGITEMGVEFLRWTLSDGAGALLLGERPRRDGPSLRIDWIDIASYADRFEVCMQMGGRTTPWASSSDPTAAARAGAFGLYQDFRILRQMFPVWIRRLVQLMERKNFCADQVDWYLCHFSSHALGREVQQVMRDQGCMIEERRWFSNLSRCGNTGAASIFVMLEEFLSEAGRRERPLRSGQKVMLCIPESGWGLVAYAMLTVV